MNIFPLIMYLHFLGDFVLQPRWIANRKSDNFIVLLIHCFIYSSLFLFISLKFAMITMIAHLVQDFITSKITKRYFEVKDYYNMFVVIGFDQFLHFAQLKILYDYL